MSAGTPEPSTLDAGAAPAEGALPDGDKKKQRAYATVLVTIPDWPKQDPNRPMIYSVRSTPQKAARMIKRLKKQMPEYLWSWEKLTATEARAIKLKPFRVAGSLAKEVEVKFTQRGYRVTEVPDAKS